MSSSPGQDQVQEFNVRIPARNTHKNFHIMKFNASLKVDPAKWTQVRMVRENNRRDFRGFGEETPKFGAGSEFGREQREEARRKKYGISSRKYNPDAQPWLMRIGNKKEGKQYRGVREGGVAENTAYYVFTHAQDGSFEAHPVKEWYNFVPRLAYKTLNAEEAEEKYAERGKILNHWAVMVNRKLRPGQATDEDLDGDTTSGGKKGRGGQKSLKISDMDDWIESGDELDSDEEDDKKKKGSDDDEDDGKKKKKKGARSMDSKKKNKRKNEADEEGFEDSDDGDGEGREDADYMSDASSDSDDELQEQANQKGVDQDEGLAKMLDSEDSEDEEEKEKEDNEDDADDDDKPQKKKKKKKAGSAEVSDDEKPSTQTKNGGKGSKNSSRATTPSPGDGGNAGAAGTEEKSSRAEKRKALVDSLLDPNADGSASKKSRLDTFGSSSLPSTSSSTSGVDSAFEEDVRRYLARKPMTTTEILKKFKSKKSGFQKDELMPLLVNVLKKINPHKQKVKGIMYLSLKTDQRM